MAALRDIRLEDELAYREHRRAERAAEGVDYAVIRMLRGELLPGSAKYYIQNWDDRSAMRSRGLRRRREGF